MTDTPDLRDQIAQAIERAARRVKRADAVLPLTPTAVAEAAVDDVLAEVAPLLAAKDQENAELRQRVENLIEAARDSDSTQAHAEGYRLITALKRERDEARARAAELEAQHAKAIADWTANDEQVLADAQRQADRADALSEMLRNMARRARSWRWHYNQRTRQRDEARAEVAALKRENERIERVADRYSARVAELEAETTALRTIEAKLRENLRGWAAFGRRNGATLREWRRKWSTAIDERDKARAELAEALEVAERAARDTGHRTPLADAESEFAPGECDGSWYCPAVEHVEGCFSLDLEAPEHPVNRKAAPSSGLAGLAAPDTTPTPDVRIFGGGDYEQSGVTAECHTCGEESGASSVDDAEAWRDRHACDTPLVDDAPQQAPAQVRPLVKPRRDERINPAGLYAEPTDPGGA